MEARDFGAARGAIAADPHLGLQSRHARRRPAACISSDLPGIHIDTDLGRKVSPFDPRFTPHETSVIHKCLAFKLFLI
jgi:hypothetical protein